VTELAGPVAIAAVLLAAGGVAKAWRPGDTARALRMVGIRVPPGAVRAGAVAEVVVGLGALFVPGPVFPALVALSYLAFAVFVLQALRTGAPISSCGCFGKVDTPPSRVHVVLDGLFAGVAAVVAVAGTDVSMLTILPDQPLAGMPFVMLVAIGTGLVFVAFTSLPRTLAAARESS
jgi:hypothetical protein